MTKREKIELAILFAGLHNLVNRIDTAVGKKTLNPGSLKGVFDLRQKYNVPHLIYGEDVEVSIKIKQDWKEKQLEEIVQ